MNVYLDFKLLARFKEATWLRILKHDGGRGVANNDSASHRVRGPIRVGYFKGNRVFPWFIKRVPDGMDFHFL